MNRFLTRRVPPLRRVLLVESGSRQVFDRFVPHLSEKFPAASVDLVTCYSGQPEGFDKVSGSVYRVVDYTTRESRNQLFAELAANRYDVIGILCSGEPIMTKWKWALAWNVQSKVFVLNENGDYFWVDRGHLTTIRHFVLFRAGLSGARAFPTLTRVAAFPFVLLYLVLYAAFVHTQRALRNSQT